MKEETLLEKLTNCKPGEYSKVINHILTITDIKDFMELYQQFWSLQDGYSKLVLGRKQASKELVEKLKQLEEISGLIELGIKNQRQHYENLMQDLDHIGTIKDYKKVFEVLKQLSSNLIKQYEFKTIQYPTFDSSERHGYRTTKEYTAEITILAEKELLLNNFDDIKESSHHMRKKLLDIYKQGSSVIIVGNDDSMTTHLDLPNKTTLGNYRPIVFYLQDDELGKAASCLIEFLKENGVDIGTIEVNELVQALKAPKQKIKKLM